jgi:hypothetical protein
MQTKNILLKYRTSKGGSIMSVGGKIVVNKSSSTLQVTLERRQGEDPLTPSNYGVTVSLAPNQTQNIQYGNEQNPYLNAMRIQLEKPGALYDKNMRIVQRGGKGTLDNEMNTNGVFELDYQPETNAFLFNAHN